MPASSLRLIELFISKACAVQATYSFLYVDHGLSQSLRFLPKGSQARGTRLHFLDTHAGMGSYPKYQALFFSSSAKRDKFRADIGGQAREKTKKIRPGRIIDLAVGNLIVLSSRLVDFRYIPGG